MIGPLVRVLSVPRRYRFFLAGGLTPDNVIQAITTAGPDGVDAHTGLENPDGSRNLAKIEAFARRALTAFARLLLKRYPCSRLLPQQRIHAVLPFRKVAIAMPRHGLPNPYDFHG